MKAAAAAAIVGLAALCLACNRRPAEEAIALAEQDIAAARPELQAYAPGELAALESTVREARAQMAQGRYTDALRGVQKMPARIGAALGVAARQKETQAAVWQDLARSVPPLQETIATRIAWLTEAQRLPRGMDEAGFAAAPAELDALRQAWARASAAFQAGDVAMAVRTGQEVRTKCEILATRLGLVFSTPPAAPPAASGSPQAAPVSTAPAP